MNKILDTIQLGESKYSSTAPEVDGINIIGKVTGESFVPGGFSRNKRFYPASLWEKVVNDPAVRKRLEDRTMYGSIGHEVKLDDAAFRNGDFTHIVSDIRITEDGKGEADYLILNTNAGRNLNTVLRAGSRVYVSTRADGAFVEGRTEKGMPIVDTDRYQFETIDFVLDPGFLQASPVLAEAYKNLFPNEPNPTPMAEDGTSKFLEALTAKQEELQTVSSQLAVALSESTKLATTVKTLEKENSTLSGSVSSIREELGKAKVSLAEYKALGQAGDVKLIVESLGDVVACMGEDYSEEAELDEQIEALVEKSQLADEALELLAEADLADEGEDLIQTVEKLIESFDAVDLVITFLEENGLKSADESLMSVAEKMIAVVNLAERNIEEDETARISALATELKVPEEKIKAVADKSDEEIRELFGDVQDIVETQVKFAAFKKKENPASVADAPKSFSEKFSFRKGLASGHGFSE